jgi:hypothetical protein
MNRRSKHLKRRKSDALLSWAKIYDNGKKFGSIWKYAAAKRIKKMKINKQVPKKVITDTGLRLVKIEGKWKYTTKDGLTTDFA